MQSTLLLNNIKRTLQHTYFRHIARMVHQCIVKNPPDGERIEINLEYGHKLQNGLVRQYNANRVKTETLSSTLTRIGTRIEGQISKKKRKRRDAENDPSNDELKVSIQIRNSDGTTIIEDETPVADAFIEGNVLYIENEPISIQVNLPCCTKIVLPESVMVGFPIFPALELEYVRSRDDCEFRWSRIKYEDEENAAEAPIKKKNRIEEPKKIAVNEEVSTELIYTPTINDLGYFLQLSFLPKAEGRQGKTETAVTKFEVKPGPGLCPFDHRHLYTQKEAGSDEVRVVSYNILADLYTDQDYSRDILFSYCPPYALSIDYRKPLLIKEIKGYKADLICLQEVDTKVFKNDLVLSFGMIGYEGFHMEKGDTREGSAIFYKQSKFRLLEQYSKMITEILETNGICQDIVKKAYAVPNVKESLSNKRSVIHILALEPIDKPGRVLLVANTHLYFHPNASHIRMVQVLTAMRYIDTLLQKYKAQKPSLIFCGDFNSTPEHAIYEYMTTKSIKEDNIDWKEGDPEEFIPEMNFTHSLNLDSGCGKLPYTNYTDKFNGHLDYIYYDTDSFEVAQAIPPPDHRDVELNTAIPSIVFPSDHIAQICDFKWKW